jgi:hypothetical protein
MGREAECDCEWGEDRATVKALLESGELILRGEMRRKVLFAAIERVRVERDRLCFVFKGEHVSLALGDKVAAKWAEAIAAPPATLAKKLGIKAESSVRMLGPVDDDALETALSQARR